VTLRFCSQAMTQYPVSGRLRGPGWSRGLVVKWVPDQKRQFQITIFLLEYPLWRVPSVFPSMQLKRKHPRAPRVLLDRRSSALAAIIPNPNLTTSVDAAEIATTLKATRPLVRYFDGYGGFSALVK